MIVPPFKRTCGHSPRSGSCIHERMRGGGLDHRSAHPLCRDGLEVAPPFGTRTFTRRARGRLEMREQVVEQRIGRLAEKPFRGGRPVGTADEKVVHGRQCREPAVAETVSAMVVQGQLSITSFHAGTAALEQVRALAGDGFDVAHPSIRRVRRAGNRLGAKARAARYSYDVATGVSRHRCCARRRARGKWPG